MTGFGGINRDDTAEIDAAAARLAQLPVETVHLWAGGSDWTLACVGDHDAILRVSDAFGAFPFGLVLWDAAPVLADAMAERVGLVAGKRVLEIGAGNGLGGLAARRLGADVVVQTDHAPEALALARDNARMNGVAGIEQRLVDWHQWDDPLRYDLIIGSDVLYAKESHGAVLAVIAQALAPGGNVLLTDPARPDAGLFVAAARAEGWTVVVTRRQVPAMSPLGPADIADIDVIEMRRG